MRKIPAISRQRHWLCVLLFLCVPNRVCADDLVIGMSAAFSGPSASLGIELYRGSMAYIAQVNSMGGVNGRKLVIKAYDDQYDPVSAVENTITLIEKDQVFLLFDYGGHSAPDKPGCDHRHFVRWRLAHSSRCAS